MPKRREIESRVSSEIISMRILRIAASRVKMVNVVNNDGDAESDRKIITKTHGTFYSKC